MGAGQSQTDDPVIRGATAKLGPETLADINHLVNAKVFSVDRLCHYYKVFMRQHPTGKLTKQEFTQLYSMCFPDGNKAQQFAEHLFDVFDRDHDHQLDFREVMILCGLLWEKSHDGQIEWSFRIFDVDGDGYITREDCRDIEKIWLMQSGKFNSREINARAHEAVNLIFQDYDTDHDGRLSKEEFFNAVKKEKKGYLHMTFDDRYVYDLMNLLGGKRINLLGKMEDLEIKETETKEEASGSQEEQCADDEVREMETLD